MSDFTITPARYAKGCMAVCCPSPDGFKTRAARLCEHLKGRYSNRERAYLMTASKAERLRELFDAGHDASAITGELDKATAGGNSADPQQTGVTEMSKQESIKVIVVNPNAGTIVCIQMPNDFDHMKREVMHCDIAEVIDCGAPDGQTVNVLAWIDEEGTLKDWDAVGWTELAGCMTLAGNIVFTGPTDESDEGGGAMTSIPDYFDVAWVEQMAVFVKPQDVKIPGIAITTIENGKPVTTYPSGEFRDYSTR